jgi:hypothetical protein
MDVTPRVALWLACLWLLVACAGDSVYGDQAVLEGTARLVCSETCLSRAACRPTGPLGQQTVYLGVSPAFPGASDVAFTGLRAGTEVTILQTEIVAAVEQETEQPLEIRFYRVDDPESDATGWVPGFCLARRP